MIAVLGLLVFSVIWCGVAVFIGISNQRQYEIAKPTLYWTGLAFFAVCAFLATAVFPHRWQALILPGLIGLSLYVYSFSGFPVRIRQHPPTHTHAGPVVFTVITGELVSVDASGEHVLQAGDSLTEPVGAQHMVTNKSTMTARAAVSYLIPKGSPMLTVVK